MSWTPRAGKYLTIAITALAVSATTPSAHAQEQRVTQSQGARPSESRATLPTDITLEKAKAIVRAKGYEPYVQGPESNWSKNSLRVLLGVKEPGDSYTNFAFFFADNHYLGRDTVEPSARIGVTKQTDDTVTVEYSLYRPDDALVDPTGGRATVRYRWSGAKLVPRDPIPTADWSAPLSRR